MRLLICSHGSFDVFHPAAGPERRAPGGAFTSLAAMAQVAPDDTIVPLIAIGSDTADEVGEWCRQFPNVDADALVTTQEPTHVVHYYEQPSGSAVRCPVNLSAPIPYKTIRQKLQGIDGILIAMNSGADIVLESLDELRMEVQGKDVSIHLDVHSMVLGRDDGRGRPYRPVPTWRRWFFNCTTVQLNEVEAAAITPDHMIEEHFVKQALALGLSGLCVTRDERGATLFREQHKKIMTDEIAPRSGAEKRSPIGCGDVFAGVFLARLTQTHDLLAAAQGATMVSGWAASFSTAGDLLSIRERLKEQPLP